MNLFTIGNVSSIKMLNSEFELERALYMHSMIRQLAKKDPAIKILRNHLASLIESYEKEHWNDRTKITEEQIKESDEAKKTVRSYLMKEHDVVMLLTDLNNVPAGHKGTIVHVYPDHANKKHSYEVEFILTEGSFIECVSQSQII